MEDILMPDQIAEPNAKIQENAWIKREKIELRKIALDSAIRTGAPDLVKAAQEVYEWLIEDLI